MEKFRLGLLTVLLATVASCEKSFDPRVYSPFNESDLRYFSGGLSILKVAGQDTVGGISVWHLHYLDSTGRVYLVEQYVLDSKKGPLRKSFSLPFAPRIDFEPAIPFCPPSATVGASDTVSGKEIWADAGTFRFRETRTVEAIENVTTPAGTFNKCVRVRFDHVYLDKPPASFFSISRYWFAENVGIVKYELTSQKAQGELEKAKIANVSYPE